MKSQPFQKPNAEWIPKSKQDGILVIAFESMGVDRKDGERHSELLLECVSLLRMGSNSLHAIRKMFDKPRSSTAESPNQRTNW